VSIPVTRLVHRIPDRLDLYALRGLLGPLLVALGVVLVAQLLERLLRLFEIAAATGASPMLVLEMIGSLVPHYLGIALPAAFFAAIFMATARIGDDNELDAMLATGRSISRMAVPHLMVGGALVLFNLYLFGYLQPLTRYNYNATVHEVRNTGWNARLEANRFVTVSKGYTLAADRVAADGRTLGGVFVERHDAGTEQVVTAAQGRLVPSLEDMSLQLELGNGMIVDAAGEGHVRVLRFTQGRINEDFTAVPPPYRERGSIAMGKDAGDAVRELTLPELLAPPPQAGDVPRANRAGEFHGRLARCVMPLLLPLLALPLGMAAKRGRRVAGTVFAVLAVVALDQALSFGEAMAETGRAIPWLAVWLPVVVFAVLGLWLFRSSLQWPGDNPVMRAVSAIESAFEGMQKRRKAKSKDGGTRS
jgi:lipopolysaccharide export system permease protein